MGIFRRIRTAPSRLPYRGKARARAYAVGDIHGRLDLLEKLLEMIERDCLARAAKKTYLVFLGDLIDRGPDSAGVVERLRTYVPSSLRLIFLAGNHEEVLLRMLQGEKGIFDSWLRFGGAECARSYGIDPDILAEAGEEAGLKLLKQKIPPSHVAFLESFADTFRFGDFLFVHAGIRPGIDIGDQDLFDLRWIREPFLSDTRNHGFIVVHGHTIVPDVREARNRIAIDTGAYHTGRLSALGVEDDERWILLAEEDGVSAPRQSMVNA